MRFVDTSFWIALQSQRDRNHGATRALLERGLGPLLTTNQVIGETWTVSRRMREALAFDGDFSAAGFVEVRP